MPNSKKIFNFHAWATLHNPGNTRQFIRKEHLIYLGTALVGLALAAICLIMLFSHPGVSLIILGVLFFAYLKVAKKSTDSKS